MAPLHGSSYAITQSIKHKIKRLKAQQLEVSNPYGKIGTNEAIDVTKYSNIGSQSFDIYSKDNNQ